MRWKIAFPDNPSLDLIERKLTTCLSNPLGLISFLTSSNLGMGIFSSSHSWHDFLLDYLDCWSKIPMIDHSTINDSCKRFLSWSFLFTLLLESLGFHWSSSPIHLPTCLFQSIDIINVHRAWSTCSMVYPLSLSRASWIGFPLIVQFLTFSYLPMSCWEWIHCRCPPRRLRKCLWYHFYETNWRSVFILKNCMKLTA